MSHKRGKRAWLDSLPPVSEQSIQRALLRIHRVRLVRTLERIEKERCTATWRHRNEAYRNPSN